MKGLRFFSLDNLPLLLVMAVWALYTIIIIAGGPANDDFWFHDMWLEYSAADYVYTRYMTWSGRILPDLLAYAGSHYWLSAILINYVGLCLMYFITQRLLDLKTFQQRLSLSLLFCIFPFYLFCHAGYVTTTIYYLWPLVGVLGLFLVYSMYRHSTLGLGKTLLWTLLCFSMIFFIEQTLAITMVLSLMLMVSVWIERRHIDRFLLSVVVVCALGMVFALTAPGNIVRLDEEIQHCMQSYPQISFIDKICLGIIQVCHVSLATRNLYMLIFSCLIFYSVYVRWDYMSNVMRACGILPLVLNLSFVVNGSFLVRHVPEALPSEFEAWQYAEIFVVMLYFLSCFYYLIFSKSIEGGLVFAAIILVGCMSQAMMGLSPTVYASGIRTSLYLQFCMMFVIAGILKNYHIASGRCRTLLYLIWGVLVVFTICTESIYILRDTPLL